MLLSATPIHTHHKIICKSNLHSCRCSLLFLLCPNPHKSHAFFDFTRATIPTARRPLLYDTSDRKPQSLPNPNPNLLHHVSSSSSGSNPNEADSGMVPSASAVALAIRAASNSPVDFTQRIEKDGKHKGLVLPSPDFQRLCIQQLDLFRRIVHPDAVISVYVRPAGSYVMDRLELRRVTCYPGADAGDIVILIGDFGIPTGLRAAESALASQEAEVIPNCKAAVFPLVKHPFVVGFLVAELPSSESPKEGQDVLHHPSLDDSFALPHSSAVKPWEIQTLKDSSLKICKFTAEQISNAVNISHSLAMAYVMDQKALLLQQSSWQNSVRMSNLVEQIRGPLSSIQTLSKMLCLNVKKSEVSYDIVQDILVQGDRMRDTLQQLQDAVYLTKTNIVRYNEESLKRLRNSFQMHPESLNSQLSNTIATKTSDDELPNFGQTRSLKDSEMPMPPLALSPVQQNRIRPCDVFDVLADLVDAVRPLAHKQQRMIELSLTTLSQQVAVEEPALRQALSNLIEGALLRTHIGGRVEIVCTTAPAGGTLVVVDDDGPDMHYMTQMHALTPFGADLLSEDKVQDNMTWNFIAGLTVAREILESYGCVVRVISPRISEAALGAGGTRLEIWLPSADSSDPSGPVHDALQ